MKLQPRIHNFCENSCLSFLCLLQDDLRELDHGHVHYEEMEIGEEDYSITEPVTADFVQADTAQANTVKTQVETVSEPTDENIQLVLVI